MSLGSGAAGGPGVAAQDESVVGPGGGLDIERPGLPRCAAGEALQTTQPGRPEMAFDLGAEQFADPRRRQVHRLVHASPPTGRPSTI